ncbi:hypothetical protein ACQJBY_024370 [Aegilops geniculata]
MTQNEDFLYFQVWAHPSYTLGESALHSFFLWFDRLLRYRSARSKSQAPTESAVEREREREREGAAQPQPQPHGDAATAVQAAGDAVRGGGAQPLAQPRAVLRHQPRVPPPAPPRVAPAPLPLPPRWRRAAGARGAPGGGQEAAGGPREPHAEGSVRRVAGGGAHPPRVRLRRRQRRRGGGGGRARRLRRRVGGGRRRRREEVPARRWGPAEPPDAAELAAGAGGDPGERGQDRARRYRGVDHQRTGQELHSPRPPAGTDRSRESRVAFRRPSSFSFLMIVCLFFPPFVGVCPSL